MALLEIAKKYLSDYSKIRANTVETKWLRNSEALRSVKDGQWAEGWKKDEGTDWRSDTFVNITHQKVMAAQSLIADMFLQNGKIPFQIDIEDVSLEDSVSDVVVTLEKEITKTIKLVNVDRILSKSILSICTFGECYARFAMKLFKEKQFEQVVGDNGESQGIRAFITSVPKPTIIHIPVWDLFFDCSFDNITDSPAVIHRQYLSKKEIASKIGRPYFLNKEIKTVLSSLNVKENKVPSNKTDESPRFNALGESGGYPVYEFWGRISLSDVKSFEENIGYQVEETEGAEEVIEETLEAETVEDKNKDNQEDEDTKDVEVMLWFIDDKIIRYTRINDADERPFVRCLMEEVLDSNWGVGVADNLDDVQKVLNGAVRAFEDNKKLSGNVITATKDRFFEDDDGKLRPGKVFHLTEDCSDARQAIQSVIVPDIGNTLMDVIQLFNDRFADEFSQIPKVTQGINSKKQITAYEISQQVENAGKYIGGIVRNIDEYLLEPMLNKFLKVILEQSGDNIPPEIFQLKTLGFKTFQNRVLRLQKLQQLLNLANIPSMAEHIKLKELLRQLAQGYDIDTEKFIKTDEELAAEQQAQAQAQQQAQEIEMQQIQLTLAKLQAETQLLSARTASEGEKVKIEQAKLINQIEKDKSKEVMGS
jgi:hypothetical protein